MDLCRIDVEVHHAADRGLILLQHGFFGASAFFDIALDAASKTELVSGLDKDFRTVEFANVIPDQSEDAFDYEVVAGDDTLSLLCAGVLRKIIDRPDDNFAACQRVQMLAQKF